MDKEEKNEACVSDQKEMILKRTDILCKVVSLKEDATMDQLLPLINLASFYWLSSGVQCSESRTSYSWHSVNRSL